MSLEFSSKEAESEMSRDIEQIRRAHKSARPKQSNPAWCNTHRDLGVVLVEIGQARDALKHIHWLMGDEGVPEGIRREVCNLCDSLLPDSECPAADGLNAQCDSEVSNLSEVSAAADKLDISGTTELKYCRDCGYYHAESGPCFSESEKGSDDV